LDACNDFFSSLSVTDARLDAGVPFAAGEATAAVDDEEEEAVGAEPSVAEEEEEEEEEEEAAAAAVLLSDEEATAASDAADDDEDVSSPDALAAAAAAVVVVVLLLLASALASSVLASCAFLPLVGLANTFATRCVVIILRMAATPRDKVFVMDAGVAAVVPEAEEAEEAVLVGLAK
jgi:hypothetical protein